VEEQGDADAAPVLLDAGKGFEIDFHQHWNDHQPDQHRHRQIDLSDLRRAEKLEKARHKMAQRDAEDDAQYRPKW